MRTTVRIDDELLQSLKERARKENTSLTRLIERILRAGIKATTNRARPGKRYREELHSMGEPRIMLDKALAIAAALEDDEIVRKLRARK